MRLTATPVPDGTVDFITSAWSLDGGMASITALTADLSAVNAVIDAIPPSKDHALVMKSTVPSGTGVAVKRMFDEQGKDGLGYVSCPEFLKEGSAIKDFMHPDRVVIGDVGD